MYGSQIIVIKNFIKDSFNVIEYKLSNLPSPIKRHSGPVAMSKMDSLRSFVVTVGWDGKMMVWDIVTGNLVSYFSHPDIESPPRAISNLLF